MRHPVPGEHLGLLVQQPHAAVSSLDAPLLVVQQEPEHQSEVSTLLSTNQRSPEEVWVLGPGELVQLPGVRLVILAGDGPVIQHDGRHHWYNIHVDRGMGTR